MKAINVCVALVLCACGPGAGAGSVDFTKDQLLANLKWDFDSTTTIYGGPSTLYLLVHEGFVAIDTTTCANPNITSSGGAVTGGQDQFITLRGPHLYYRDGIKRFHAYDLTDPKQPAELGIAPNLPSGEFLGALEYSWTTDTLVIKDWTNPLQPQMVGTVSVPGIGTVKTAGGHLFAQDLTGTNVFDVSDPRHPTVAKHIDTGYLYTQFSGIAAWSIDAKGVAHVIEASTPASAHIVGTGGTPLPTPLRSTSKDGRYWFTFSMDGTRGTWDLNDPSAPRLLFEKKGSTDDASVTSVDETCLYVTTRQGLYVYAR